MAKSPKVLLFNVQKKENRSGGGRVLSLAASRKVLCPIRGHPTHQAGAAALFFIVGPRSVRLFLHGHNNHGTVIILLRRGNERRGSPPWGRDRAILAYPNLGLECEQTGDGTLEDSDPPPMRRQVVDLTRPVVTYTGDNDTNTDEAIRSDCANITRSAC